MSMASFTLLPMETPGAVILMFATPSLILSDLFLSRSFQPFFYTYFPMQPSHQLPLTTMSRTRIYYISSIESKLSVTFTPRVLGVFSTPALAVASVEKITPRYVRVLHNPKPCVIRYVGNDSDIKIVSQHSHVAGASKTPARVAFLAIDACDDEIVEANVLRTAHDAWAACEAMKRKCGNYWKDEIEWTDNRGCKHGETEFNVSHQLAGLETKGIFKHHWYVEKFVVVT